MKFQLPHFDTFIASLGFIYILILGGTLILISRIFHFSVFKIFKKIFGPFYSLIHKFIKFIYHLISNIYRLIFSRLPRPLRRMVSIAIMVFIIGSALFLIFRPKSTSAAWFDDSWAYRRNI